MALGRWRGRTLKRPVIVRLVKKVILIGRLY